jgi:DNA-directed RNA polymerase delta subunit
LHDDIAKTVEQLIVAKVAYKAVYNAAKKNVQQRRYNHLFNSLINQVNALYGLSEEEVATVMNDDMFETDLNED